MLLKRFRSLVVTTRVAQTKPGRTKQEHWRESTNSIMLTSFDVSLLYEEATIDISCFRGQMERACGIIGTKRSGKVLLDR